MEIKNRKDSILNPFFISNIMVSFRRNVSLVEKKESTKYLRSVGTFDTRNCQKKCQNLTFLRNNVK